MITYNMIFLDTVTRNNDRLGITLGKILAFISFYYLGHLTVQANTENGKNGHCAHRKRQFPKLHKIIAALSGFNISSKSNSKSYANFSSLNHRFKKLLNGFWSKKM